MGGVEIRTPIGTAHTAINRWGLPKLNEVNPMVTPLFYYCKLNAKKKVEPVRNQGESEVVRMEGWIE